MHRLSLLFVLLFWCAAAGCGKKARTAPEREPDSGPQPEEKPALSKDQSTRSGSQELRITSRSALESAFSDNPQRAKKEYGNVRWRLHVRVDRINETRLVGGVVESGDVGYATIEMRSKAETEKLSTRRPAIIEARVDEFKPHVHGGVHFIDGVFTEEAAEPEPAPKEEITRELTAVNLSKILDALDRGQAWSAGYRKARWSFSGTVVKPAPNGLTHIVNIPNVGQVEVGIPDRDKTPQPGDHVDLTAIISKLTPGENGKPMLVFTHPRHAK